MRRKNKSAPAWSLPEQVAQLEKRVFFHQICNFSCLLSLMVSVAVLRQQIGGIYDNIERLINLIDMGTLTHELIIRVLAKLQELL